MKEVCNFKVHYIFGENLRKKNITKVKHYLNNNFFLTFLKKYNIYTLMYMVEK